MVIVNLVLFLYFDNFKDYFKYNEYSNVYINNIGSFYFYF